MRAVLRSVVGMSTGGGTATVALGGWRRRLALATALLAITIGLVAPPSVFGAQRDLVVDSEADDGDADLGDGGTCATALGQCTLRAAIETINAEPAGGTTTIRWAFGDPWVLELTAPLVVDRPGTVALSNESTFERRIVPADGVDFGGQPLLTITSPDALVRNLTFAVGASTATNLGGALRLDPGIGGRIDLLGVDVEGRNDNPAGAAAHGGGVAALSGTVNVRKEAGFDAPVLRGVATNGVGGALAVAGGADVTLTGTVVTGGEAVNGGGIAVLDGSVDAQAVDVRNNQARVAGGDVTSGAGAGVLVEGAGASFVAAGSKIRQNGDVASAQGGGITVRGAGFARLERSELVDNSASVGGGGALVEGGGELELDQVALAGNGIASGDGGGLLVRSGGGVEVLRSSFVDNAVSFTGRGGAVHVDEGGRLLVTTSTFAFNDATEGGAIATSAVSDVGGLPAVRVIGSTVAHNTADDTSGGIHCDDAAGCSGSVTESVVADNEAAAAAPQGVDCVLTGFTTSRSSIGTGCTDYVPAGDDVTDPGVRDNPALPSDAVAVTSFVDAFAAFDAALGEVSSSQYYVLPPAGTSQVVDALPGPCAAAVDQLGSARPQGGGCDLGAVERVQLTVDTTADLADPTPGDGTCGDGTAGTCSLRAALAEVDATQLPTTVDVPAVLGDHVVDTALRVDGPAFVRGVGGRADILSSSAVTLDPVLTINADAQLRDVGVATYTSTPIFDVAGAVHVTGGDVQLVDVALDGANGVDPGGALRVTGASVLVLRSTVAGAVGPGLSGGAISVDGGFGSLNLSQSTVSGTAENGGALAVGGDTVTIVENTLLTGDATLDGGAIAVRGGGDGSTSLLVSQGRITGATAVNAGGAIHVRSNGDVTVRDVRIDANQAERGAGIAVQGDGSVVVERSLVDANGTTAGTDVGGGLWLERAGTLRVFDSTITGNAATFGGGVGLGADDLDTQVFTGFFELAGVTVARNSASEGAGVNCWSTSDCGGIIRGTALVANVPTGGGDPLIAQCDLRGASTGESMRGAGCAGGTSTDDVPPPADEDGLLGPLQDNGGEHPSLAPAAVNELVDAYDPPEPDTCQTSDDQARTTRPQGPRCDIGAIELPPVVDPVLVAGPLTVQRPTVPAGAAVVPLGDVPPAVVTDGLAAASLGGDDGGQDPVGGVAGTPLSSVDVAATPLSSVPLSSVLIAGAPLSSVALAFVPLSSVPLSSVGGWDAVLRANQPELADVPLQALTLADLSAATLANVPLSSVELQGSPLSSVSLAAVALAGVPLSSVALPGVEPDATEQVKLQAWCDAIADSQVTCADLGIVPAQGSAQTILGLALEGAPLSSVPLSSVKLSGIPLSSVEVEGVPLSSVPLSSVDVAATPLSSVPLSSVDVVGSPLSSVPLSSVAPESVPLSSVPLSSVQVQGSPLSSVPLSSVDLSASPLSSVPLSSVDTTLFDCTQLDCTEGGETLGDAIARGLVPQGATFSVLEAVLGSFDVGDVPGATITDQVALSRTLADVIADPELDLGDLLVGEIDVFDQAFLLVELIAALPPEVLDGVTLGELLIGLLPPTSYPWKDLDPGLVPIALSAENVESVGHELPLRVDDATGDVEVDVDLFLPPGARYVPGSVQVLDGGTPVAGAVVDDCAYDVSVGDGDLVCDNTGERVALFFDLLVPAGRPLLLTFDVVPGPQVGVSRTSGSASLPATFQVVGISAEVEVTEPFEPNDTPGDATLIQPDTLYVSPLSSADDVDLFAIDVPDGARLSVNLSNLPADYDLAVFGDRRLPLRREPVRSIIPQDDVAPDQAPQASIPQATNPASFGDLQLVASSRRRGVRDEQVDTRELRGGRYLVRVSGHDGASSLTPFALRATVVDAPAVQCAQGPLPGQGPAGQLPAEPIASDTTTLFLLNQARLGAFGGSSAADVRAALDRLAARGDLGVRGVVVPVEGDPAVAAAYAAWDADACAVERANDVVRAVGALVDRYLAQAPGIEHVVLVGDDGQVPFARVPDPTTVANERGYATEVELLGGRNALSAALASSHYLSDDPYGARRGIQVGDRELFVPSLALGRLVETPADIVAAVQRFEDAAGRLDASTTSSALAVGYEFLSDGVAEVADNLALDPRRTVDETLNADTWTADDLRTALAAPFDVLSLNAHADDSNFLSAAESVGGTQDDLFTSADLAAGQSLLGDIVLSMGCHAGTNVPDLQIGVPRPDFAETIAREGAVLLAGTSYEYGDTEVVAYTEALMAAFAANLDGTASTGEAMVRAKQAFATGLASVTPYDEKVLQSVTFYGLPMLRVGPADVAPPPLPQGPTVGVDPVTGLQAAVVTTAPTTTGIASTSGRGLYYRGDDGVVVSNGQPLQPKVVVPVAQPGTDLEATGALITALSTTDVTGVDPVIARSIVDEAGDEPEPVLTDLHFPSQLQGVSTVETQQGLRQNLVLVAGQFNGTSSSGTQRLVTSAEVTVFYDQVDTPERTAPIVDATRVELDAGTATIGARVRDDVEVVRVLALVTDAANPGTWTPVELAPLGGDRWAGSLQVTAAALLTYVQAVDSSGNVTAFSDKGELVGSVAGVTDAPEQPVPGEAVGASVAGDRDAATGWYTSPATITLVPNQGTTVRYRLDGGPSQAYTGPFQVTGDGRHVIEAIGSDGARSTVTVRIDQLPPTVQVTTPAEGAELAQGSVVPIGSLCRDAGIGVASCSVTGQVVQAAQAGGGGPTVDTSTPGTVTITVTGEDRLGRTATATRTVTVVAAPDDPPVVADVALVAPPSPITTVDEVELAFTVADEDPSTVSASIDWGDGIISLLNPGETSATHVYAAPGSYTPLVVAVDAAGQGSDEVSTSEPVRVEPSGPAVLDPTTGRLVECTILGTDGNDRLRGTDGRDVICGFGGNDRIFALDGDDLVDGGEGNDRIEGGDGDDVLLGGDGNDRLDGDAGADALFGGDGNDKLRGHGGGDLLDGGRGNDDLDGDGDDDELSGGDGNDKLRGHGGDDELDGGEGNDKLEGGEGADVLLGGPDKDDLSGDEGDDTLDGGPDADDLDGGGDVDTCAIGPVLGQDDLDECEIIV